MTEKTVPAGPQPLSDQQTPHLTLTAGWEDPETGALWVHKDMVQVREDWEEEGHISPVDTIEAFGDTKSFTDYIKRYGDPATTFITWNEVGLNATLDYHTLLKPGRATWHASLPFVLADGWKAWRTITTGQPVTQQQLVETIENRASDVTAPIATDLANIVRNLRANINRGGRTEYRPDGTTAIEFNADSSVKSVAGKSEVSLPESMTIQVQVHRGHNNEKGQPIVYPMEVRIRVFVNAEAKPMFRLEIPLAEAVLEKVYQERVLEAQTYLGPEYPLARARAVN